MQQKRIKCTKLCGKHTFYTMFEGKYFWVGLSYTYLLTTYKTAALAALVCLIRGQMFVSRAPIFSIYGAPLWGASIKNILLWGRQEVPPWGTSAAIGALSNTSKTSQYIISVAVQLLARHLLVNWQYKMFAQFCKLCIRLYIFTIWCTGAPYITKRL